MKNEICLAGDSFTDEKIVTGTVVMVQSLDGNELQYDTLDATLDFSALFPTLFMPSDADGLLTSDDQLLGVRPMIRLLVNDPSLYKYGAEVIYKHNAALVGKYYMTSMKRVGKTQYRITCVSPVGLLANSQHYGGIYSGVLFPDLLQEIIGGVVPFTVAPELANQPVYGWLPVAKRRDNLHQALFAMGAAAQKDANGDLYITPLSDEVHTDIPDNRLYVTGSVSYPDAVTKVSISEHSFVLNEVDETVTLFEGIVASERITTPAGIVTQGAVVLFSDPMHDLAVENGEILESGVNYAVLAPAAEVKLTGQKYTHTVRQVTRPETAEEGDTETENKITVTDATLVSIANSENVADRLMSYYSSAKTISTDIVVDTERAGSAVGFTDPFGDATKGIIKSMEITMSNTLKAHAEIVADYSPGGAGNFYTNVAVITEDGAWVVPEGVTKIRVTIIGGGSGGSSGASGENGENSEYIFSISSGSYAKGKGGEGGKGGAAGTGGLGGRILVASLNVTEGESFPVTVGSGGAGGVCAGTDNAPGEDGADSSFGEYTSANGTRSATGYADLFGATTYGLPGTPGTKGSDGVGEASDGVTTSESITIDGVTYICGATGEEAEDAWTKANGTVGGLVVANGGYGGGAAVGANGGDGQNATTEVGSNYVIGYPGSGGHGAPAAVPGNDGAQYGAGGQGGHGGGGGGGAGSGIAISDTAIVEDGAGGAGGLGSNGGRGANGCVLVYY